MAWHRLTEVDPDARTATCSVCGPVGIRRKGRTAKGTQVWACRAGANRYKRSPGEAPRSRHHRRDVADRCERCGWVADHPSLLDVHHRDGNHANDAPENLATLCPICHRREHLGL